MSKTDNNGEFGDGTPCESASNKVLRADSALHNCIQQAARDPAVNIVPGSQDHRFCNVLEHPVDAVEVVNGIGVAIFLLRPRPRYSSLIG